MVHVYNTLSGKKEPFEPLAAGKVGMYVCGVTVYDDCHLGHARCYIAFDVIRRYLEYRGMAVTYVQNFTDIDDKIIARAAERGVPAAELTRTYEAKYFEVFDRLNVRRADRYPRATEEIGGMIGMIGRLMDKGHAYEADGDVYFSTKSFSGYGKLSKRSEDSLLAGARVEISDKKRDPLDFALWKKAKAGEPFWPSPWGDGRPGWHIECSVMSQKYVGVTLDVHGGGQDLIFPHHENEIAQSEADTGRPFVRYFLHNGFVTVDGEKMSKSMGNFRTLEELYRRCPPDALRFFILSTHYRSPLTFTAKKLEDATAGLSRLREGYRRLKELLAANPNPAGGPAEPIDPERARAEFEAAMDDDFNTAEAVGTIFRVLSEVNRLHERSGRDGLPDGTTLEGLRRLEAFLKQVTRDVLGIDPEPPAVPDDNADRVSGLLAERERARKEKRYKDADRLRMELLEMGYQIQDTPQGPRAIRK
ncbi:MAG: cysteine--tRNA ligase [Candidatus Lindowbacteria bacterium RIFCSPLOWO2_12_FULL_62_27]|nr:MAG: cysteine--tRNA ligase [Candidatus Lindowbacteria bacterium RIFCSPLOWO2_12_FULL_62_27]